MKMTENISIDSTPSKLTLGQAEEILRETFPFDLDFSDLKLRTDYCNWSDPLGVSAWMNREAKYYTVEALNLVTYFLDGAIDVLMRLMEMTDELSNKLDKESRELGS